MTTERAQWSSRLGFVLAAAGSAVGLGNIWKFPYITGENGGGAFVLIYLVCIVAVGVPVMLAEVLLGRASNSSPIGAFKRLAGERSSWRFVGWMGVACGFVILSYYSVVAGWALHYVFLSLADGFASADAGEVDRLFGDLYASPGTNVVWHLAFMGVTTGIVAAGVRRGIEGASRVLMPALFLILVVMFADALFQRGFSDAARFLFQPRFDEVTMRGVLEALGHAFFTLSVGMGAMITYGSYLPRDDGLAASTVRVAGLDTLVAILACLVLFPVLFTFSMPPEAGPGLVFKSMPLALRQMTGGSVLCVVFFVLLFFAALSSAISLLEVVTATFVDELGWTRRRAAVGNGAAIAVIGVPSALSGGTVMFGSGFSDAFFGMNWFDTFDYVASNWLLPLGGVFIALFVGWRLSDEVRREQLSTMPRGLYVAWLILLRYVAPVAIVVLFVSRVLGPWLFD